MGIFEGIIMKRVIGILERGLSKPYQDQDINVWNRKIQNRYEGIMKKEEIDIERNEKDRK